MAERLRNYSARKKSLDFTKRELARINAEMTHIQGALKDGTPVSGGTNQREERLVNLIMAKMDIEAIRKETSAWLFNMEKAIAELDEDEHHILDMMYINPTHNAVDKLCMEYFEDKSTIYRRKDRALRHLTYLFYGVLER